MYVLDIALVCFKHMVAIVARPKETWTSHENKHVHLRFDFNFIVLTPELKDSDSDLGSIRERTEFVPERNLS